jgi:hypothetical protein
MYANDRLHVPAAAEAVRLRAAGDPDTLYLERADLPDPGAHPLLEHSQLAAFVWYRVQLRRLRRDGFGRPVPGAAGRQRTGSLVEDRREKEHRRTRAILARFVEECRAASCRVIAVNVDQRYTIDYARAVEGLSVYDLAPELQRLGGTRNLRFTYDPHYNEATHAYLGERLTEILRGEVGMWERAPAATPPGAGTPGAP